MISKKQASKAVQSGEFRKSTSKITSLGEIKRQSIQNGRNGEHLVNAFFPKLHRIGAPGADFIYKTPRDNILFFEVKTNLHSRKVNGIEVRHRILLKTRNGQWVNNKAHYVIFITGRGPFIGRASDIRLFVKMLHKSLPKLPESNDRIVRVLLSVNELAKKGLLQELGSNPAQARVEFDKFMAQEHARALDKELEREKLLQVARKKGH